MLDQVWILVPIQNYVLPHEVTVDEVNALLGEVNTIKGAILVLQTPIIKYIFETYLGIICITVGKNGKENMKGLKAVQLSTVLVTLWYSILLDDLPVKGSILLDFLVFYS